jgi:hypothetical protein
MSLTVYTHPLGSLFFDGVGRQNCSGILTTLSEGSGKLTCQCLGFFTIETKCCHPDRVRGFDNGERDDRLGDRDWWVVFMAVVSGFPTLWTRV